MLTALARGAFSLGFYRLLLGIGEPGIFPAGVKACGEWFPQNRRALATGIFSSGGAVGAVIAAPLVVWITLHWGWRASFLVSGIAGLLWLPLWLAVYRHPAQHPAVTAGDRAMLNSGAVAGPAPGWREVLGRRHVWGLVLSRIASDPVWYFYLFWLPDYFHASVTSAWRRSASMDGSRFCSQTSATSSAASSRTRSSAAAGRRSGPASRCWWAWRCWRRWAPASAS